MCVLHFSKCAMNDGVTTLTCILQGKKISFFSGQCNVSQHVIMKQ